MIKFPAKYLNSLILNQKKEKMKMKEVHNQVTSKIEELDDEDTEAIFDGLDSMEEE